MNKYDQEFKDDAAGIALSSDRPLTEIALDLGVNYKTFSNGVRVIRNSGDTSLYLRKEVEAEWRLLKR